jgi:hypothetical protein
MVPKNVVRDPGHFHAVRFYKDAESLSGIVAGFLAEGIADEQPVIVIATPAHRACIEQQLTKRSIDVARMKREGTILLLDADATLAEFMVDGMPDAALFKAALIPIIERACRGRKNCVVRAYGEMVDVLWKAGHTVAATRLETLWNALSRTHAFSLLCGYAMGSFYKDSAVEDICAHHSHVVSENGQATAIQ